MDEKHGRAPFPPYEPHPGAAPSPIPTGPYAVPQGAPPLQMTPQSPGQPVPPYGSPPPMHQQPFGAPPGAPPQGIQLQPVYGQAPPPQGSPPGHIQQASPPPQPGQPMQSSINRKPPPGNLFGGQQQQQQQPHFAQGASQPRPQQPQMTQVRPQQQQQQQQQSMYQTAVPLASLTSAPAPVDCPLCKTRGLTRVQYMPGNTAHGWAAMLCICLCLGCIPYLINNFKDCEHYCSHCGTRLVVWHNSGRTVVEAHG